MLEEQGRVVGLEGEFAWIETERISACASCSVNKGCGTGAVSKYFGARTNRVKAINEVSAKVGDAVVLGLDERALVRGSLAVYIVPLLTMFVAAFFGDYLAGVFSLQSSDGLTVVTGLLGLVAGFIWVNYFSRKVSQDERYQPIVMRLVDNAACSGESIVHIDNG